MMSPFSRDLLHRVILQSDTFLSVSYHPMTAEQAGRMADRLTSQLGCSEDMEVVTCLSQSNTQQILFSALSVSIETNTFGWQNSFQIRFVKSCSDPPSCP